MKPVSFNEDAKECSEDAVETLRHESNTPRSMWGPGGDRQTRQQAFGVIIRSMGSYKEDRFHRRDLENSRQGEGWWCHQNETCCHGHARLGYIGLWE